MRIKMLKDHTVDLDVNNKRKYPKGLAFNLPEERAHAFVAAGAAEYVNAADAKAASEAAAKEGDGFDDLKKAELEALAAERKVDISEAKTKADIIERLRAAPPAE